MVIDLYTRTVEDPNFIPIFEHSNPIESIISKIKMILNTPPGTVLGNPGFGVGIEDLVFSTKINKFDLEQKIKSQINEYVSEASSYQIDPKVSFGKADGYDYALIDIYINSSKTLGLLIK